MSAAGRRWPALIAASLGLHLLALAALPGMFSRDASTPLYVDLTALGEPAALPGTPARASGESAVSGETRRQAKGAVRPAPTRSASGPVAVPVAPETPSAPAPSASPAPPSLAPPAPEPAPAPTAGAPPAPAPVAPPGASGAAAPTPGESRPGPTAGTSAPRDAGQGSGTDADGGVGGSVAGPTGALLALARPGEGRGVPAEYAPYLARFRQRVEEALIYPLAARRRGQEGRVELEVLLEPNGRVGRVAVAVSSANAALDEAALAAVRAIEPAPFPPDLPRRPLLVRLPLVFQLR
jgi:periplasmic protein TonB